MSVMDLPPPDDNWDPNSDKSALDELLDGSKEVPTPEQWAAFERWLAENPDA